MTAPLFVGTAGWTVPARYADEFPAAGSHLERYALRFSAVEINSSFHRPHRPATYARWAASVPEAFRFAVKMPKTVTHERRLIDCGDLVRRFLAETEALGHKLGVVLVQLPPKLAFERGQAEFFLTELCGATAARIVCEPRHPSWFAADASAMLAALSVARVAADPAPVAAADEPGGWTGLAYYRLHGSPRMYYSTYEPTVLAALHRKLVAHAARGTPTWCMFDNTASGAAVGDALALQRAGR